MIFVASLDGPMLNAYIVAHESKFINSTCELQQLYTKYANQCWRTNGSNADHTIHEKERNNKPKLKEHIEWRNGKEWEKDVE